MKQILTSSLVLAVLATAPAFAQRKATVENVREIRILVGAELFETSVRASISANRSQWRPTPRVMSLSIIAAPIRACLNSTKPASSSRKSAAGYYGFEFAHSVRVDKDDNIWTVDEGTNMITKFSPDGKVLMVLGRRPPAVDGRAVLPRRSERPGAEVYFLPADGRGLGPAGQHLRFRRLLQQPRREI